MIYQEIPATAGFMPVNAAIQGASLYESTPTGPVQVWTGEMTSPKLAGFISEWQETAMAAGRKPLAAVVESNGQLYRYF